MVEVKGGRSLQGILNDCHLVFSGTIVEDYSILSGGFQGQSVELEFLASLFTALSGLLIMNLADLLVTDAETDVQTYLYHCRIIKCYVTHG